MEINKKISVGTVVGSPKQLRLLLGTLPHLLIMEVFGRLQSLTRGFQSSRMNRAMPEHGPPC